MPCPRCANGGAGDLEMSFRFELAQVVDGADRLAKGVVLGRLKIGWGCANFTRSPNFTMAMQQ